MPIKIPINKQKLNQFCRKRHICKLWLFGSVLRDDFRDDSDIDVLYEFEPNTIIGFKIFEIEEELSQILGGRKVDLLDEKDLSRRIKRHKSFHSEMLYDKG
ncbi:MAG: nucleotidyltransferase domain-containing protein [Candidatus Hatepunaea meridiana]|nr:nucleotidyltransferase domain-containing protein [Candidatus Hatepunaea meridiana]